MFLLGGFFTFLHAQQTYKLEKWGKVSESDLTLTHCSFDSGASSMILQDVGRLELTYTRDGWRVLFNHRRRIKIFDESALDQGNLRIYYRSDRDVEKFKELEIQVIQPNGEVQKVKSDNIFTEKISKYTSAKKVFIPNIQKGSIVEYRYELESAIIVNLYETWYFQQDIPVRWSQLTTSIPQYFIYVYLMQATRKLDLNENQQESVSSAFTKPYAASVTTFGLSHLPAVKEEPFITTLEDYRAHIGFQLSEIAFPGTTTEKILTSWPELAKKMDASEDFGGQYRNDGKFDKIWSAFRQEVPESTPRAELPEKVLRFVSTNIKWNGENRRYPEASLNAAFVKKTGSTADLNLTVIALLRKLKFDAIPILISTRDNGMMYDMYPFADQFNTVVAFLIDGDNGTILDATNPKRPPGEMRPECYNKQAWMVDEKRPNWVDIAAPEHSETWLGFAKLNEEGVLSGRFTIIEGGPGATAWRSQLEGETESQFLKAHFATEFPERSVDSVVFTDLHTLNKPLKVDFYTEIPNAATVVNDYLYIRPILDFFVVKNPLKSLNRSFPVDFIFPAKAQYVLNLDIPKGYVLEDVPQPVRISLPENSGKIQFSVGKTNETNIQVVLKMNISKLRFLPSEYDALKQFFELMAEKVQLQLALKKA
jgi:hypothetical protein